MENSVCAKNYTTAKVKITPNMLCASLPGRDSCSGGGWHNYELHMYD